MRLTKRALTSFLPLRRYLCLHCLRVRLVLPAARAFRTSTSISAQHNREAFHAEVVPMCKELWTHTNMHISDASCRYYLHCTYPRPLSGEQLRVAKHIQSTNPTVQQTKRNIQPSEGCCKIARLI